MHRSSPPASTTNAMHAVITMTSKASHRAGRATQTRALASRSSPTVVALEMQRCYDLVEELGRGVVYLGSARRKETDAQYALARELARDVARALDCTTWSGVGPGFMDAVTKGALDADKPVGGFMILLESGQRGKLQPSRVHPYLPQSCYLTTSFFSARKHGLVDAGVRVSAQDRTAFIALPGGVGTLDEIFEILALLQLKRIGSAHDVPFIFMNYDGHYDGLLSFLARDMVASGALGAGELDPHFVVCDDNAAALAYLDQFYTQGGV